MSTTFAWIVEELQCYPQFANESNVVFNICWRCNAAQDDFSASIYGSASVQYTAGTTFTPYADLTQDQVLGWLWGVIDKQSTEANLQGQLNALINPPVVSPPLPWGA